MKKYILTLIAFLPLLALAQKQDSVLFTGATKIIIKTGLSANDNYQIAAQKLLDQSYSIEKSDKEFFQLYSGTTPVYGEGVSRLLSLYVLSREGQIIIVGRTKRTEQLRIVNAPMDTDNFEIMPYKNSRLMKEVFAKTAAYAKTIGSKLIYSE
ncbi:MAG: hypothetical protein EOO20_01680 [Chryseobacterium sp.]|nr:MAG: hypothetical protein EOO20_01680 [Chryseobacterium sp.]